MRKLIAIVGPTASGKTTLAIQLAQCLDGEIIGADSRQVYRHMAIGTAKPTVEEQIAARHHLIDIVDPDEPFSLGRWVNLARAAIDDIWSRGKQPLLVGGTGQYIWALLEGWRVPQVPPQDGLREELTSWAPEDLLAELWRVDPEAEAFVDPRNVRRVVRALEVYHATGKPFSHWRTKEPPGFESTVIGMRLPREQLYRRIDERVEAMFASGLVEEIERLLTMGYARELPSMSGIGYREVCAYLADEIDLGTAIERTKTSTHRFARHQNSWFKQSDERIVWIEAERAALADRVIEKIDVAAEASGGSRR
jgi:tRNA dimethylallyltransferase